MNYIIIPYRKREKDLEFFLNSMPKILDEQIKDWKILIIEQDDDLLFNRGKLLNCGFLICNDIHGMYFFHDVDTVPLTKESQDRYSLDCSKEIIGIYNSVCNTLGGIIKCSGEHFQSMNGFPNDYWGWGCEDKALQNRADFRGIRVSKRFLNNSEGKAHFVFSDDAPRVLPSDAEPRRQYEYNIWGRLSNSLKEKHILSNGLESCVYTIKNEISLRPNIIHYKVQI